MVLRASGAVAGLLALASACAPAADLDDPAELAGKADSPLDDAPVDLVLLTSREYKILLEPGAFADDPPAAVAELLVDVAEAAETAIERELEGEIELDKERLIRFFDTPGSCDLRSSGFVLRERIDVDDGDRSLTLKFRSPDRYVAAGVDTSSALGGEDKFEEDIVPPYDSKYSRSTKVETQAMVEDAQDLAAVFPGVEGIADGELATVSGLSIFEEVYGGVDIDLGKLDAKISVTLWYFDASDEGPALAELSFGYKADNESFPAKTVTRGIKFFEALSELDSWRSQGGSTKTASVYQRDPAFCE